ncbi:hypothetical protein [Microbulbifer discodermiae]|uniref:hypothetical protein n=1 Tax=Microbulbifer sp. 2201CG32-9 TaxID=3232309 RepID=UPI00345BE469
MRRTGKLAVPIAAAAALQGCILLPVDNDDDNDPFFFNPDQAAPNANFVEAGYYRQTQGLAASSERHCPAGVASGKSGPCWFFPVIRFY